MAATPKKSDSVFSFDDIELEVVLQSCTKAWEISFGFTRPNSAQVIIPCLPRTLALYVLV